MKRFIWCVIGDIKIQIKSGFYSIYLLVTIIYIILLRLVDVEIRRILLPVIIFSDPAMIGLFFLSTIIYFEKAEGTLNYLLACPLKRFEYVFSKVLSLNILVLLSSWGIVYFSKTKIHYALFFFTVTITSFIFSLIGMILMFYSRRIYNFFVYATITTIFCSLPLLVYFSLSNNPLMYIIPSYHTLDLLRCSITSIDLSNIVYGVLVLVSWGIILFVAVVKAIKKYAVKSM